MEISGSAFSAGLSALQSGQRRIDQAGADIAGSSVQRNQQAPSARVQEFNSADQASNLVDLNVGKFQAEAGAQVIKTADDVLGTLIDTRA